MSDRLVSLSGQIAAKIPKLLQPVLVPEHVILLQTYLVVRVFALCSCRNSPPIQMSVARSRTTALQLHLTHTLSVPKEIKARQPCFLKLVGQVIAVAGLGCFRLYEGYLVHDGPHCAAVLKTISKNLYENYLLQDRRSLKP